MPVWHQKQQKSDFFRPKYWAKQICENKML